MKSKISGFFAGVLSTLLVGSIGVSALAATGQLTITVDPINIQVNGATFQPKDAQGNDVPVFAYNGTTYAPLRAMAEAYGLEVGYDAETNMAIVKDATIASSKNNLPNATITQDSLILYVYLPGNEKFGDLTAADMSYQDGVIFSNGLTHFSCEALRYAASENEELMSALNKIIDESGQERLHSVDKVVYNGSEYVSTRAVSDLLSSNTNASSDSAEGTFCLQFKDS